MKLPKITFWRAVATIIILVGLYSTYMRFFHSLESATALNDTYPWGLWIGFDVLIRVGLAAGGFTICAVVHIFNIKQFKPLVKPAILTAFIGYSFVVAGLLMEVGRPWFIWHTLIYWNHHSVLFEIAWCVMLYSTVLMLEFTPVVLEKYNLTKLQRILKKISTPIFMAGIILSTLHQSSLGSLFLIIPSRMNALWYSSLLPVYFYLSAIGVGFMMIIFQEFMFARAFNKKLPMELLSKISVISIIFFSVVFAIKIVDLSLSGAIQKLAVLNQETMLWYAEILIGTIIPVGILSFKKFRENRATLYTSAAFAIAGFMFNRLNVSVTAIASELKISYFPSLGEVSISMMLVTVAIVIITYVVKNFNVFPEGPVQQQAQN